MNAAVKRIGERVGVNPDTLRGWCKQAAIDVVRRREPTTSDARRIKDPEAENRELKRANEILLVMQAKTMSISWRDPIGDRCPAFLDGQAFQEEGSAIHLYGLFADEGVATRASFRW